MSLRFYHRIFLAILLALPMGLVWNEPFLIVYIFIVFGLLLFLLEGQSSIWKKMFCLVIPFTLFWNVSVLWWVWNASPAGAVSMAIANCLILSLPYLAFLILRKRHASLLMSYLVWISLSLGLEYLHYNWEGNFPWLNLGNIFAHTPVSVQWISYTGVAGISLWILVVNSFFHHWIIQKRTMKKSIRSLYFFFMLMLFPMLASWIWVYLQDDDFSNANATQQVVIIQPNIDTYQDKFSDDPDGQVQKFLNLSISAQQELDSHLSTIWVWPETCIPYSIEYDRLEEDYSLSTIKKYLSSHPNIHLVTGTILYRSLDSKKINYYNSAIYMNGNSMKGIHIKSKLVPGSETIPYHNYLSFLDNFIVDLGGVNGSLAKDSAIRIFPLPFSLSKNEIFFSIQICYESVFGEYVSNYVKNGSELITLITNDDWWGNTPGHIQHFNYGKLRAIENRRFLVRSANTGISAVVNPYGNVVSKQLNYKEEGTIVAKVPLLSEKSFYTQHGDFIYRMAIYFLLVFLLSKMRFLFRKNKCCER